MATVIFSKKCELGLQAVLLLSVKERDNILNATEISEELKVPKEFVSKVLQTLTSSNIVASKKGKNGGFYLNKHPKDIRLIEIIAAIDGYNVFENCVLGFPGCSNDNPCPVHNYWGQIRDKALEMLSSESLEDFKEKTKNKITTLQQMI